MRNISAIFKCKPEVSNQRSVCWQVGAAKIQKRQRKEDDIILCISQFTLSTLPSGFLLTFESEWFPQWCTTSGFDNLRGSLWFHVCGWLCLFGSMRVGLCATGRAAELMTDAERRLSFLLSASVGGCSAATEPPTQKRVRFTPACSPNELQSPGGITHVIRGRDE